MKNIQVFPPVGVKDLVGSFFLRDFTIDCLVNPDSKTTSNLFPKLKNVASLIKVTFLYQCRKLLMRIVRKEMLTSVFSTNGNLETLTWQKVSILYFTSLKVACTPIKMQRFMLSNHTGRPWDSVFCKTDSDGITHVGAIRDCKVLFEMN